jgi:hypothetical protein
MFLNEFDVLFCLLIASAISAYVLVLKRLRQKPIPMKKIVAQNSKKHDYPKITKNSKKVDKATPETMQQRKPQTTCSHHFGYLSTLPKNSSLPNECLGCTKIVECLTFE